LPRQKWRDKFNAADPSMASEKCYQKKYAKSAQLAANAAAAYRKWEPLRPFHKSKEDLSFALCRAWHQEHCDRLIGVLRKGSSQKQSLEAVRESISIRE